MVELDPTKRRRVPRRQFRRNVGVLVSGKYTVTQAIQIGEGGLLVRFSGALKVGQKLVVNFKLPNVLQSIVKARVKYVLDLPEGGKGYGIEFENLDVSSKREIRNYVASKTEEEFQEAA